MTAHTNSIKLYAKKLGLIIAVSAGMTSGISFPASAQGFANDSAMAGDSGRIYGFRHASSEVGAMSATCAERKGAAILGGFVIPHAASGWQGVCLY